MKKGSVLIAVLASTFGISTLSAPPAYGYTLQQGVSSAQVLDLQQRLGSLGLFKAGSTGYYGPATKKAVMSFQRQAGLPASGNADEKTVSVLNQTVGPDPTVLEQMARIIHSEARGESFEGKVAIGAVVLNRVQSGAFPDSITEVIFQPGQFSAIKDGQYNLTPDSSAYEAAKAALNGADPTNGALYYYNPKLATSSWSKKRPKIIQIDQHIFTS
ncbi:cell wall hydrolase [Paenibacillus sp. HJGM_3]|uniref:cell wall hydrolase n=1 Tax=Paenibacillus sp. HJGM_3 TaxID=3379816 RepID=UPI00385E7BFD